MKTSQFLFVPIAAPQPFRKHFANEQTEWKKNCRENADILVVQRESNGVSVMWAKQFSEYLLTERNLLSGKTTCETIECWTIQWTQYKPDSSNTNNVQSGLNNNFHGKLRSGRGKFTSGSSTNDQIVNKRNRIKRNLSICMENGKKSDWILNPKSKIHGCFFFLYCFLS